MEKLRHELRELRRCLVALNDSTGAVRPAAADVQVEAMWTTLLRLERMAGVEAPAQGPHRFPEVFCSQCGGCFGPGNAGFSACHDHRAIPKRRSVAA